MLTPTVTPTGPACCAYCAAATAARTHAVARNNPAQVPHGALPVLRASVQATARAARVAAANGVQPCTGCTARTARAAQRASVRKVLGYAAACAAVPLA